LSTSRLLPQVIPGVFLRKLVLRLVTILAYNP
jgi:hypothetical protein